MPVALAFTLSLDAGRLAIALLKLALQSGGQHLLQTALLKPNSHVALSTMTYGALGPLLGDCPLGWRRGGVHAAIMLLICGIAVSRHTLHAHNLEEVLAGLTIGLL